MKWINVKDALPEEKSNFLGTDGEIVFAAYWTTDIDKYKVGGWESCHYCGGSSEVSFLIENFTTKKITHWMPLPEPSKSEE